jgi:acetyltransferase-like isoleucine patch superfamily enzyme
MSGPHYQLSKDSPLHGLPLPLKKLLNSLWWLGRDSIDFMAEIAGWFPCHTLRLLCYRHLVGMRIAARASVHRNCRSFHPAGISIGFGSVINRNVLLDGRSGLRIGDNVSISEGVAIFTLDHDPNSPTFEEQGAPVNIGNRVFIGAQAIILPGVALGEGAVVGAGAVVTHDVPPFTIVAGVPARPIGERRRDLAYTLNYRKFLG